MTEKNFIDTSAFQTETGFDFPLSSDWVLIFDPIQSSASETSEPPARPMPRPPVSALDVAEYVLRKIGPMSTMKLQKLVYYCQAWSLVWDESPLFHEEIEAWANGPVIRNLYNYHRGRFTIDHVATGNPDVFSQNQKETIDAVLDFYGNKSAQWLVELSHQEQPWRTARRGLSDAERGSRTIPHEVMFDYYSSIPATES